MNAGQDAKILLVEDHPIVRDGVRALFAGHGATVVVGEAASGEDAIAQVEALAPDIVLLDISLPDGDGLDITGTLYRRFPRLKVIIHTAHENKEYILRALRAGARGYVHKNSPSTELLHAVDLVHAGKLYFPDDVLQAVTQQLFASEKKDRNELTKREREVLAFIAEGYTNKETAGALSISARTVETHRENIMAKLDIHTTAGLTRYAIANQIG